MFLTLPSALSVWACTRSFRYAARAMGTPYRTVRENRRQWKPWICLRLRASGHAATATCGPSRRAVPMMKIQHLWTQTHHHPPLQSTATAPTPVSNCNRTCHERAVENLWFCKNISRKGETRLYYLTLCLAKYVVYVVAENTTMCTIRYNNVSTVIKLRFILFHLNRPVSS